MEVNSEDANRLGLNGNGGPVKVTSRRGSITVNARRSDDVPPGVVFMTFHFKEAAANLLTSDVLDPVSKIPGYKVCAVRIEKI